MLIAIELIDTTIPSARQVPVAPEAEVALRRSVMKYGILQAITVRQTGNRYELVLGRRRLRAAAEAGLIEIPADIRDIDDAEALALQVTENMQRQRMHPVDQWFSAHVMLEAGAEPNEVATVLGLDSRGAQRMARLGQLHPAVLKAIERSQEFPTDGQLRAIANASEKVQAAALKIVKQGRHDGWVNWSIVAEQCRGNSISRAFAIFDLDKAKIAWDEDLFAEPGSDEQFTTRNVEQFLKLQRAELEARVAEAQKKKKRMRLAEFNSHGTLIVPKGWREIWDGNADKPRTHEHIFLAIGTDGRVTRHLVHDTPSEKAAYKLKEQRAKGAIAGSAAAARGEAGGGDGTIGLPALGDLDDAPIEMSGRGPLTKAGLSIVAAAKTEALRKALTEIEWNPITALALTVLAFAADNVAVRGLHRSDYRHHPDDLVLKLLLPGGDLDSKLDAKRVCEVAAELLGRFLTVGGPDAARHSYSASSGDAAEWIGRALGAAELLPRFDTEDFLKHVSGSELKRLAGELSIRTTMKLGALRSALAGNAPNWRPDAAQFGAAAPVMREDLDDDREDAGNPDDPDSLEDAA